MTPKPYSLLSPEERAKLPGPVADGDAELEGVSWRGKWHSVEAEIRVPSPTGPVSYRMAVRFRSSGWHVHRVVDAPKGDPAHKPVSVAPFGDREDAMRYAVEWAYRAANPPAPPLLAARSEYMAGARFVLSALDDLLAHALGEKKSAVVDEILARALRLAPGPFSSSKARGPSPRACGTSRRVARAPTARRRSGAATALRIRAGAPTSTR